MYKSHYATDHLVHDHVRLNKLDLDKKPNSSYYHGLAYLSPLNWSRGFQQNYFQTS